MFLVIMNRWDWMINYHLISTVSFCPSSSTWVQNHTRLVSSHQHTLHLHHSSSPPPKISWCRKSVKTPNPIQTLIYGIVLRYMYWDCSGDMVQAWYGIGIEESICKSCILMKNNTTMLGLDCLLDFKNKDLWIQEQKHSCYCLFE